MVPVNAKSVRQIKLYASVAALLDLNLAIGERIIKLTTLLNVLTQAHVCKHIFSVNDSLVVLFLPTMSQVVLVETVTKAFFAQIASLATVVQDPLNARNVPIRPLMLSKFLE